MKQTGVVTPNTEQPSRKLLSLQFNLRASQISELVSHAKTKYMLHLLKKIKDLQLQVIFSTYFWTRPKNRGFWNIIQQ